MSDIHLIKRFLAHRWLQNALATAVTAISIALAVTTLLLAEGLHGGLVRATEPFPILMGAKGSPNQLVLNCVFLQDQPIGNIPYAEVEKLRADKNVASAVPLAFGDSYMGYRIVGTEKAIFQMGGISKSAHRWLKVEKGREFENEHEAVLGSSTAASLGLKVGDTFSSVHGLVAIPNQEKHDERFTVVGILAPHGGPYDSAILTGIENIWKAHAHHDKDDTEGDAAEAHHEGHETTAVIIKPTGYGQAMQLAASYSKDVGVQVVFPAQIIVRLFYLMGNVEGVMKAFSYGAIALALAIIACSMYWSILGSQRDQGIMRAIGATQGDITTINFKMGLTIAVIGTVLGTLLGHAAYLSIAAILRSKAAISATAGFLPQEAYLIIGVLICASVCAWLPSAILAKRDIVESL